GASNNNSWATPLSCGRTAARRRRWSSRSSRVSSGANDLVANVTCWDPPDAPADSPFTILIVQ
ncbi:MAG TPA: hypothetical protein VFS57_00900, partial [Gemmatimonadaceae bacterium]|nr:hypothetical protein [Gemmatimonadaceae bacterium]